MPRVKLFDEQEVLSKAMNLFWKQGYSATSVQDLVSHLGINRASLYDTYGDKDQLFKRAFELYREKSKTSLNKLLQSYPIIKEGFKALFSNTIEEAVSDSDCKGCFVVNTTTEMLPGDSELLQVIERNKQDVEELFHGYIRQGLDQGQFETDMSPEDLASYFYTVFSGLRVVSKINPDKAMLHKSVNVSLSVLR